MPVLKFKKADGTWQEVWGALTNTSGGSAEAPKLTSVTILASKWQGSNGLYSQVVACNGVNVSSKLDLQPTPTQIVELQNSEISLMATNSNGVVTVYAIGNIPATDMTMQILITEVSIV